MKCVSTDTFTNVSLKSVSTDNCNECVSTEYVSTDVSMERVSIDISTGLSTESVFTNNNVLRYTNVSTNIPTGVSTDYNVIRYTSISTNVSARIFMDVPTIVINNTTHDIDNNNKYKDEDVLDKLIKKLRSVSGQEDELMVNSGFIHEHSDDTIKWLFTNKVASKIFHHLDGKTIQHNEKIKNSRYYFPNNDQLCKGVKDPSKITMKNMRLIHHYAAWILFVYKMVRINLQAGVARIYILLKPPTEQDYKKLGRGISYPNGNVYLPLLIVANNNRNLT